MEDYKKKINSKMTIENKKGIIETKRLSKTVDSDNYSKEEIFGDTWDDFIDSLLNDIIPNLDPDPYEAVEEAKRLAPWKVKIGGEVVYYLDADDIDYFYNGDSDNKKFDDEENDNLPDFDDFNDDFELDEKLKESVDYSEDDENLFWKIPLFKVNGSNYFDSIIDVFRLWYFWKESGTSLVPDYFEESSSIEDFARRVMKDAINSKLNDVIKEIVKFDDEDASGVFEVYSLLTREKFSFTINED